MNIKKLNEELDKLLEEDETICVVYYPTPQYEGTLKISDIRREIKRRDLKPKKTEKGSDGSSYRDGYYKFYFSKEDEDKVRSFVRVTKDVADISIEG